MFSFESIPFLIAKECSQGVRVTLTPWCSAVSYVNFYPSHHFLLITPSAFSITSICSIIVSSLQFWMTNWQYPILWSQWGYFCFLKILCILSVLLSKSWHAAIDMNVLLFTELMYFLVNYFACFWQLCLLSLMNCTFFFSELQLWLNTVIIVNFSDFRQQLTILIL